MRHPNYAVWQIAWNPQATGAEALFKDIGSLLHFQSAHVVRQGYRSPELIPDEYRRRMCMNIVAENRFNTIVASARLTIVQNETDLLLLGLDAVCDIDWPLGVIDFVAASEPEALSPLMTELVRLADRHEVVTLAVKQGEAPFAGVVAREDQMYSREGLRHTLPLNPSKQSNFHRSEVDQRSYAMYRISSLMPLIEGEPDAWRSSNPGFIF